MNSEPLHINFSGDNLIALNICLAFIMFGVALNIKKSHFIQLAGEKKAIFTGLFSQLIIVPAMTFLLAITLPVSAGTAMGMILVAACPGGNVSNFFSMMAKGNVALAVTLTAVSSVLAFLITPFNFFFWASLIPSLSGEIKSLEVGFLQLLGNMTLVLLLPLLIGMWVSEKYENINIKIGKPVRILSVLILSSFIALAFYNNREAFLTHISSIFWIVFIQNGLALIVPYFFSKIIGNTEAVNRTIAIESGIHNSGLGLILIFTFFNGNFQMALIAAWWGIWHLISGFSYALIMRNVNLKVKK